MATLGNVLTSLAYRLGEASAPTDAVEVSRRINFVQEGYKKILNKYITWWWLETADTFDSDAGKETYTTTDGFPSDYRDMLELRVDDYLYTPIAQGKIFGLYNSDYNFFNYQNLASDKHWYVFGGELHILPATPSNGTDNISIKYFKYPTMPTTSASVLDIPDSYAGALDAFAFGRLKQLKGKRGDGADGYNEFNDLLLDMTVEQNKRAFWNKSIRPTGAEYLVD
jgi:hypothetical protein